MTSTTPLPTTISFVNANTDTAHVYWIPSDGSDKRLYRKLKKVGDAYTQPTYCGHRWNVETSNGDLLLQTTAQREHHLLIELGILYSMLLPWLPTMHMQLTSLYKISH